MLRLPPLTHAIPYRAQCGRERVADIVLSRCILSNAWYWSATAITASHLHNILRVEVRGLSALVPRTAREPPHAIAKTIVALLPSNGERR
jgi:hypothetical protein